MHSAVIIFPGSNCDRDMVTTLQSVTNGTVTKVWHADTSLPDQLDFIAIPGGFSYGDYLRSGAIAARSPIMNDIIKAADKGIHILGVCNGFQILTEAGLLPGTLMRNKNLKFICKETPLTIANQNSAFTKQYDSNTSINIPIAHHDGNYFADDDTLKHLADHNQIAFTYSFDTNPNGSQANIAGILSDNKRVLGMMPHPERACDPATGNTDGRSLFESLIEECS